MKKLKQFLLRKRYEKAKPIYIICDWAKYGVLEAKWTGKFDKDGDPLIIYYTDCNGTRDLYYITKWYNESTGSTIYGWFFNKQQAQLLVDFLNEERKKNVK